MASIEMNRESDNGSDSSEFNATSASNSDESLSDFEWQETSDEEELMIGPYLYEPEAEPKRNGDGPRPEAEGDDDEGRINRLELDNLNQWCQCGHCQILETEQECVCCMEIDVVKRRLEWVWEESGQNEETCMTDTAAFASICLNPWVLQLMWTEFQRQYGRKSFEGPANAKLRHVAYRSFVRWCWGYLGKENRRILPACVVSCIRAHFPEDGYEEDHLYKGFRNVSIDGP
ncbi:P2X purinoceptor 7-like [Tubulanus polymorphus]|uniref:P2X purinoceptor 7-like n=1 Tax=Tubulanus polymorphus TaxID=672921 RepID=UPI003DA3A12E